jgi:hypothetical protein
VLDLSMFGQVAGDQAGSSGAGSRRGSGARLARPTQVVVAAKADDGASVQLVARPLPVGNSGGSSHGVAGLEFVELASETLVERHGDGE